MTENTMNFDATMSGDGQALLANRYRIIKQLGQGGMGSVWLAEDTKLDGHKVALKMLPSVLVSNKRAYKQVKQEALVSLKLSHPNIATVRAFEEEGGNPFLVMDYIDGSSLDDYLGEHEKLDEADVVELLMPVADALDYAHKQGVVHRDVKPANVMVSKEGVPYVLDFGIAREVQDTMTRVTGKLSSGTLLYMSPEQLNGEAPSPKQDVYSFGAMVYECLTGAPPFVRGGIEDQIKNKIPEALSPDLSIGGHVMAALAKDPSFRPVSCKDVLRSSSTCAEAGHFDQSDVKPLNGLKEVVCDQEPEDHAESDLLRVKIEIAKRDIGQEYARIAEYCGRKSGYDACLDLAEKIRGAAFEKDPVGTAETRACYGRLDEARKRLQGLVAEYETERESKQIADEFIKRIEDEVDPLIQRFRVEEYAGESYRQGCQLRADGEDLKRQGRHRDAVKQLKSALEILSKAVSDSRVAYKSSLLAIADEYRQARMMDKYEATLEKLLEVFPESEDARSALQTVRDTKGYSVLGASIDGREVCGAKLYSGEDVIQLPARMRVETLREEGCLVKFMEGSIEYLGWVIPSRVRQMSSGCVLIPLHKNLSRSELAAALRKKSLAQYAWFMSKVVMTTLAVSAFIGMFSAGCAESGVKIVVGSCCFAIAALVAWNVAYRKFLKSEEWDVLFGGDRYGSCSRTQYESSINIMGEGK